MKKLICVLLTAVLLAGALAGCGAEKKEKNVDLAAVYDAMQQTLPEMMTLDEENMLNLLGIRAEDCTQAIAAVCAVGLQADEVWLLQAKDAQALERLKTLAASRMAAKLEVPEFWLLNKAAGAMLPSAKNLILFAELLLVLAVSAVLLHGRRTAVKLAESMQLNRRNAVLVGILLIWCLCSMSGVSTYLYFKF